MEARPPTQGRVLIVDDEVELMTALSETLTQHGYETTGFTSGREALQALERRDFDLLLTDLSMPEMDGISLLKAALEADPFLVGILMTGQGSIQSAVDAMKVGAFDYVLKPFKLGALLPVLSRAMELRQLRTENLQLRETVAIHELSKVIAYTLDMDTLLGKTADAALQQCGADEASIMLPTPGGVELYVHTVRGDDRREMLGKRVPLEQGIAGWVARHQEPVLLQGEVADQRFAPVQPRPEIRSAISMPMVVGGQLVGVLNVNVTKARRPLTLGQVKALTILASTAASALESSRLYRQKAASEARYRTLFDAIDDGLNVKDLERRYVTANAEFLRRLGLRREDVVGKTADDLYGPARARETEEQDRLVLQTGQPFDGDVQATSAAGTRIHHIRKLPIRGAGGEIVGLVTVSRDETERRQAVDAIRKGAERLRRAMDGTIQVIAAATELRDPYTAGHQRRVAQLAALVSQTMGLASDDVEAVRMAGQIHDIGKISVPAEILTRPGQLSDIEYMLIKGHSQSAYDILKGVEFPWPIADMVHQHHERLDGSGYPLGLADGAIVQGARIIAVADVVEAMASHRPYRPAQGLEKALEEIAAGRSTRYDPEVVDACLAVCRADGFALDSWA